MRAHFDPWFRPPVSIRFALETDGLYTEHARAEAQRAGFYVGDPPEKTWASQRRSHRSGFINLRDLLA